MRRLFVDIDDTLIKWRGIINDSGSENWDVNLHVVEWVDVWIKLNPFGKLTFWSSGGRDYAYTMAKLAYSHLNRDLPVADFESKFNIITTDNDLFLDDLPFKSFAERSIHPDRLKG